jgi:hypothetical protein
MVPSHGPSKSSVKVKMSKVPSAGTPFVGQNDFTVARKGKIKYFEMENHPQHYLMVKSTHVILFAVVSACLNVCLN